MIREGFVFHLDKSRLGDYPRDYGIAFTAASFPWVFVTGYFLLAMLPPEALRDFNARKETMLAGHFSAPISAGVLFSMLAAAGLSATWLFRKARVLAIFGDLDTGLLILLVKKLLQSGPPLPKPTACEMILVHEAKQALAG